MQLIIISLIVVGIAVFLLSFNIIFRKDGKFPETEIGHNKEMRRRGLMCAKSEEKILWHKNNPRFNSESSQGGCCSSCCCGDD